jgi:AraC-like DNA-binding protein
MLLRLRQMPILFCIFGGLPQKKSPYFIMRPVVENIPKSGEVSLFCVGFRGKVFRCPYHQHPEVEILLIEKSSGRTVIGDTPGEFGPGQLYLFPANLPHLFLNPPSGKNVRREAWSSVIQFLPDFPGENFWQLPEMRSIGRLWQHASRGLRWEGRAAARATGKMEAVLSSRGAGQIAALIDLLEYLASNFRRGVPLASAGYSPMSSPVISERLRRVLDYMHRELEGGVRLTEAARIAGLSVSGFGRFFQQHMGSTFVTYLVGLRLAEAKRLLIETDLTIAEICFRCGFGNLSNFNRHFQFRNNAAPSEFRRKVRIS